MSVAAGLQQLKHAGLLGNVWVCKVATINRYVDSIMNHHLKRMGIRMAPTRFFFDCLGQPLDCGSFVRVLSLPPDSHQFGGKIEKRRQTAIGGVCRVTTIDADSEEIGWEDGEIALYFVYLNDFGMQAMPFGVFSQDIERIEPDQDYLDLYRFFDNSVFDEIAPYGHEQNSEIFKRLRKFFGGYEEFIDL